MHILVFFFLLCCTSAALTQSKQSSASEVITVMDFVRTHKGKEAEARYFYENNWLVFRKEALKSRFIARYQLLSVKDSSADYDTILITHYSDSTQFAAIEKRFTEVMKQIQPQGLKLLNSLKPREMTTIVRSIEGKSVYFGATQNK
ncbi:MAG: hypothetical protein H9535_08025 [Ignavibacteria bacterium]|nr:hypothetical protein [Ignavibacteria bacterium]